MAFHLIFNFFISELRKIFYFCEIKKVLLIKNFPLIRFVYINSTSRVLYLRNKKRINKAKLSVNGADVQKDRNPSNKRQKAKLAKKVK